MGIILDQIHLLTGIYDRKIRILLRDFTEKALDPAAVYNKGIRSR